MAGENQVWRYFVESAGLDPENGIFLPLNDIGLQGTVHFAPGQGSRGGTECLVGFGKQRIGHGANIFALETFR